MAGAADGPVAGTAAGQGDEISLASVGRSAFILTAGTLVAQLFVVLRELFLASEVGPSSQLDAVLVGVVLPVSIGGVLTTGTMVALVPAYLAARQAGGIARARIVAGAVMLWMAIFGILAWLLLEVLADYTVRLTGAGLDPAYQSVAAGYLRVAAPLTLVTAVSSVLFAVCQAENRFRAIAISTVTASVVSLVTLVVLWPQLGLGGYAVGTLIGPIAGLLVLAFAAYRQAILPKLVIHTRGLGLRAVARHAIPLTISSSLLQLNTVADVSIASTLAPGAVSALRYGQLLINVPIGAMAVAWGRAIYPALAGSAIDRERPSLARTAMKALRYIIIVFTPIAVLTAAVAPLVVNVAFGRGAFSSAGEDLTTQVVVGLSPIILIGMAAPTLTSALNARRMGMILLAGGAIHLVVNVVADVALGLTLGVVGIALASSLSAAATPIFFGSRFRRLDPAFDPARIRHVLTRALVAAAPGAIAIGAVIWLTGIGTGSVAGILVLALAGILGLVSYGAVAWAVGLREPVDISAFLIRRVTGRRGRRSSAGEA